MHKKRNIVIMYCVIITNVTFTCGRVYVTRVGFKINIQVVFDQIDDLMKKKIENYKALKMKKKMFSV